MAKDNGGILKWMAEYDRRYVYLALFLVMVGPLLRPIGMPISVSPDTRQYYQVLQQVQPGDKVFFTLNTEFSGYNEIQSGIIATMRLLVEKNARVAFGVAHVEATVIPELIVKAVQAEMTANDYQYGRDYIILGYIFPNEAAVAAGAQDFHSVVTQDWLGRPIAGTFLDEIDDWEDWDLIADFTTGIATSYLINHYALRGTPMIMNCIGVMIASEKPYLDSGILLALLQSMRGGAELEFLIGHPGPGLTAMDGFSFGHYALIIFILIGNVGYFGYTRQQQMKISKEAK